MHGKNILLKFKIIVFWVMKPCNLTVWNQDFSQDILPPSSDNL